VIVLSLRGDRGLLSSPCALTIEDYANQVVDQIGRLRLERPVLLGVSFGGAVALEVAVEHPRFLGGLIVHGAEARYRVGPASTIARRVLERFPLPRDNDFVNQFFNLLYGGRPGPGPLMDFVIQCCWETDQAVMASRLRALEAFDVTDRLWRIDVPTLVLAGSRDVVVPPARQQALATSIEGARYDLIEDAGHIGFLTHGAEVARRLGRLPKRRRRATC
jgi:pimeloyl-ACP methyl ester carboxylesterase